ncbi:hypothetical protein GCM10011354_08630 [Egicoccus halophilus]|uniref:Uncharacterized protein n=1 Tax=Egicoccus halophilus TaxID=1670830 RepID=A0A8J3A6I4_9ACTN|nr:hypothetical protein GCM10011354_08630 [Egicoccus halophilus]
MLGRLAQQLAQTEAEADHLRRRVRDAEARLAATLEREGAAKRNVAVADGAVQRAMEDAREQADELRAACEREVLAQLEAAERRAAAIVAQAEQQAARQWPASDARAPGAAPTAAGPVPSLDAVATDGLVAGPAPGAGHRPSGSAGPSSVPTPSVGSITPRAEPQGDATA